MLKIAALIEVEAGWCTDFSSQNIEIIKPGAKWRHWCDYNKSRMPVIIAHVFSTHVNITSCSIMHMHGVSVNGLNSHKRQFYALLAVKAMKY